MSDKLLSKSDIEKELKMYHISIKQMSRDLSLSPTYVFDILNGARGLGDIGKTRMQAIQGYIYNLSKKEVKQE